MKKLVKAYFEEAIWWKEKYIPTVEEYMSNALISYGYPMLSTIGGATGYSEGSNEPPDFKQYIYIYIYVLYNFFFSLIF